MKRVGKPVFFIVVLLIAFLTVTSFFGISNTYGDLRTVYIKGGNDIRWGIDVRGGVDVTFTPPEGVDATDTQMTAAESVIKQRLISLNITDSEVYTDTAKDRIIVRFPWKEDEEDFDPEKAIEELGATAELTFREGIEIDDEGKPTGTTLENVILNGNDVDEAVAGIDQNTNKYIVSLELTSTGAQKFADATGKLAASKGQISIWMDDTLISAPSVNEKIPSGKAMISGNFTSEEAQSLANKINSGALPFKLQTENFSTINPTLGLGARDAMVLAGVIAFILICIFMVIMYKLPGVVACIALLGQVAGTIAAISGYFPPFPSFTLTLPGIAGIILAIGIGVDANVITAERIKEEIKAGRTLDGAISTGYSRAFSAIFDGNITIIITALVLMGAFGAPTSMMAKLFSPIFSWLGSSTAGAIYSFGYTLVVGVVLNFLFGVLSTKLMTKSLSQFKAFRKPKLYGGAK